MHMVSVIMPLYNVETCMKQSIQSVLNQTYSEWELILINDGSPDNSGAIADEFAALYPDRIRVLHQENHGQGGARNAGVDVARGDYLFFMDSDDTIEPNLLEVAVRLAVQQNADVVAFEYDIRRPDGSLVKIVSNPFNLPKYGNPRVQREFLLVAGMPWNKLFDANFYRSTALSFPEKVWYEDLILCTKMMSQARTAVHTTRPLYHYYLRPGSTMRNKNTARNREIIDAMENIRTYFEENDLTAMFRDELCCLAIDNVYSAASLRLIRINPPDPLIKELRQYMHHTFPDYRKNPYIPCLSFQYRLTFRLLEWRMVALISLLTKLKDSKKA